MHQIEVNSSNKSFKNVVGYLLTNNKLVLMKTYNIILNSYFHHMLTNNKPSYYRKHSHCDQWPAGRCKQCTFCTSLYNDKISKMWGRSPVHIFEQNKKQVFFLSIDVMLLFIFDVDVFFKISITANALPCNILYRLCLHIGVWLSQSPPISD